MQRPRTHYTKCGDIYIAYQVFGRGPIDLLYAQGWLTNVEYAWESPDYARFLTKLGRFARVIFFDKRGTGMSDRDVGVPTLEERSEDINAILQEVGSERVALLGMSEGGAICSYFAATYPETVSYLILYGSRPRYAWAEDYPSGVTDEEIETSISELTADDYSSGTPASRKPSTTRSKSSWCLNAGRALWVYPAIEKFGCTCLNSSKASYAFSSSS